MEGGNSSTVDTSRPFNSVKEAVAIFGERLLLGEIYSPSPKPYSSAPSPIKPYSPPSWRFSSPSPTPPSPSPMKSSNPNDKELLFQEEEEEKKNNGNVGILETIKKLEAELNKTKEELKVLKERGSETEVALATLNAQLHKNMSKLAQAEAIAAGKAAMATKTVRFEIETDQSDDHHQDIRNDEQGRITAAPPLQQEKKKEYIRKMVDDSHTQTQTLAHIMTTLGENDYYLFGGKKKQNKSMKQKPIIPLVGDFFSKIRKPSPTSHHHNNSFFASPF